MGLFIGPNSGSHVNDEIDSYEEGTWTAGLDGTTYGGNSYGYTSRVGNYVKVGKLVTISMYLGWNNFNGTGILQITGLPFAVWNNNNIQHAGACMTDSLTWPNGDMVSTHNWIGINYFRLYTSASNSGWNSVQCDGTGTIICTLTYFTA